MIALMYPVRQCGKRTSTFRKECLQTSSNLYPITARITIDGRVVVSDPISAGVVYAINNPSFEVTASKGKGHQVGRADCTGQKVGHHAHIWGTESCLCLFRLYKAGANLRRKLSRVFPYWLHPSPLWTALAE